MAKILVTGASGFIGAHAAAALVARGDVVRCLVRRASRIERLEGLGVSLVYGDVCDRESLDAAVAGVEFVHHLAGLTRALSLEKLLSVNGVGVDHLAAACAAQSEPPVLVYVSSLAAAGPAQPGQPRTESQPPAPVSNYGQSKRAGELAARRWAGQIPITIVRPPIVFGGGDTDGLQLFRMIARRGVVLVPGMVNTRYSVIHVEDLVAGMLLAAERGARLPVAEDSPAPVGQGIYYVATNEQPTFEEFGEAIAKALRRRRVRCVHVPRPCLWMVAAVGELVGQVRGQAGLLNLDKYREASVGPWTCSSEKIRSTLGFSPAKPLEERLSETVQWYQREGWL